MNSLGLRKLHSLLNSMSASDWNPRFSSQESLPLSIMLVDKVMNYPSSYYLHPPPRFLPPPFLHPPPLPLPAVALWGNEWASWLLHPHLPLSDCAAELLCSCVFWDSKHAWAGHFALCTQAWSTLISCLQKLAIKSWSGCQFKWNEMEPESN